VVDVRGGVSREAAACAVDDGAAASAEGALVVGFSEEG